MKKTLAWICIFTVMMSFGALADTTLFDHELHSHTVDNNIQFDFVVADNIVYMFTYGSIDGESVYGYSRVEAPYDTAPELYEYTLPRIDDTYYPDFYFDGETIWAWHKNEDYCNLYRASFAETGEVEYELEAEFPLYAEIGDDVFCDTGMIFGDFFLGLTLDDFMQNMLVTYDMEYDEAEVYDLDDEHRQIRVVGMAPYTDETVLVASCPWTENNGEVILYELDPAEEELTELLALPMGGYSQETFGYVYDRESDMLYFMMEGVLYRLSGLDPDSLEAIYDLGYSYTGGNIMSACHAAAITSDGHYIVSNGETLLACDISGETGSAGEGASIKVLGPEQEHFWDAAAAYVQENPGSEVRIFNPSELEFDLTSALVSKSDAYDIYILDVDSSEYGSMYQRGFLAPIENEKIIEFVDGVYPNLREAAVQDGSVVALPLSITCSVISYNPEVLEALGYTQADLPSTWRGFMEFLCELPERLEDTDYTAFPADSWVDRTRGNILQHVVNAACLEMQAGDAEQTFDTPEMAETLEIFEQIDFEAMGLSPSKAEMLEYNEDMYLFMDTGSFEVNQGSEQMVPLILSMEDGAEPMLPAKMVVAVVNPYSENRQAAEEYLAALIGYMPDESRANLRVDWVGGVKIDSADETLAENDAEIAMIQTEIDNATDDETREAYEEQLEEALATRDWIMEKFYWRISEDAVGRYQNEEGYLRPVRYMGLEFDEYIYPIMQKYLDGSSNRQTFMSDLDSKLRMSLQEMQ